MFTGALPTGPERAIDEEAARDLIARGASPGVAVVVDGPAGRAEFAAGTYSDADQRPVGVNTLYDVASITKLFTTALVLRLHDDGLLGLADGMGRYLPRFAGSSITVTDMLTHHARLESPPLSRLALEYPGVEALAAQVSVSPAASERFFYQNATFLFLGMLVEKLQGASLADCVAGLARELGMSETRVGSDRDIDAPPTEIRDGVVWVNRTHDESSYQCGGITGYAGVFASASDLAKFGRAWLDFKIASPLTTSRAFSCYNNFQGEEQGLGWHNNLSYFPLFPDWLFCHSGYTGPLLVVNPRGGKVYAMTMNRSYYGRGNQLYRELWAWLLEPELREAMTMPAFMGRLGLNIKRYWRGSKCPTK